MADYGVRRVNVFVTLDADRFRRITRRGDLALVLAGIDAAQAAGLHVKIDTVALRAVNDDEIEVIIQWAHGRGMDLTLIGVIPLCDIEPSRLEQFLPLSVVSTIVMRNAFRLAPDEELLCFVGIGTATKSKGGPSEPEQELLHVWPQELGKQHRG